MKYYLRLFLCNDLEQSFELAYRIAEAMIGTSAEKDFSVSADPTAVFIVLHTYNKNSLPSGYTEIARHLDAITDIRIG